MAVLSLCFAILISFPVQQIEADSLKGKNIFKKIATVIDF